MAEAGSLVEAGSLAKATPRARRTAQGVVVPTARSHTRFGPPNLVQSHTHIHTHIHTHMHSCTRTRTRTRTHTHTHSLSLSLSLSLSHSHTHTHTHHPPRAQSFGDLLAEGQLDGVSITVPVPTDKGGKGGDSPQIFSMDPSQMGNSNLLEIMGKLGGKGGGGKGGKGTEDRKVREEEEERMYEPRLVLTEDRKVTCAANVDV